MRPSPQRSALNVTVAVAGRCSRGKLCLCCRRRRCWDSPGGAYDDLIDRLVSIRPDHIYGPNPGDGHYMWTWEVKWPDGHSNLVDSMFETTTWVPQRGAADL
jgi:hypothetical protein